MRPLSNFAARDVEALLHPTTNLEKHRASGPLVIDKAEGIFLYDQDGKRYIEGLAGLWCTALGYANKELVECAAEQMSRLSFSHLFGGRSHEPAIALAEKLKAMAPCPTSKVFFTNSGSEANDTQVKLAWYYNNARGKPKKKKIISRQRAYHGTTVASASLSGLKAFHADFDLPIDRILHTDCPHYGKYAEAGETEEAYSARLAANLEALIQQEDPETVAAFIAEPVMGAGGVILPPKGYFEKVEAVLAKYDIGFIADEVICGFARTGNWWGTQTFGLNPTSISLAKAVTSAYVPLGALTIPPGVYEAIESASGRNGVFAHGFTYSGHPLACAVATKTLEIYERMDIVGHVRRMAPTFAKRLHALGEHPLVGETRAVGLLGAVEFFADRRGKVSFEPQHGVGAKAVQFAQDEGVLLRAVGGDNIGICPPLVITESQIEEMFDMLTRALDKTAVWARKEGILRA